MYNAYSPYECSIHPKIQPIYDQFKKYRQQNDRWGNTFLHNIILNNNVKELEDKIKYYLPIINVKDLWLTSQSTPLLLALKMGNIEISSLLLNKHADPNKADFFGFTPLHYACIYRLNPIIKKLIASGADPWQKNHYKKIPMDYYITDITSQDLTYPYGYTHDSLLTKIYDDNPYYCGTHCRDYSALRWFIQNVNNNSSNNINILNAYSNISIWDKKEYLSHINIFINRRNKNHDNDFQQTLITALAKHLNLEYTQRNVSCFKGFISYKNLLRKTELTTTILNKTANNINPQNHDGRTKKLCSYYIKSIKNG